MEFIDKKLNLIQQSVDWIQLHTKILKNKKKLTNQDFILKSNLQAKLKWEYEQILSIMN
jgi:hypothetical protein